MGNETQSVDVETVNPIQSGPDPYAYDIRKAQRERGKKRYTFLVGIAQERQVTVWAEDIERAKAQAKQRLDRRAERAGKEAPVAWDITLLTIYSDAGWLDHLEGGGRGEYDARLENPGVIT